MSNIVKTSPPGVQYWPNVIHSKNFIVANETEKRLEEIELEVVETKKEKNKESLPPNYIQKGSSVLIQNLLDYQD